ncbi:MAG TPA: Na+/H+ antiporter NhaA [Longimicrobiaceae bacterium]|nr:Na+/H+ antiporter NhaA [Longimicrobiaceae bacterium]
MASAPLLVSSGPRTPIERILTPFQRFARVESSGGIVLILCTLIALVLANSPLAESYHHLWETDLEIGWANYEFHLTFHHFINDGLMAVFFFLVGLEIKREVLVGELASVKRAALPIAAAVGGMVVPALVYAALNAGGPGASGWGIPMATDIAFALGVLALLGPRAPLALKVFLAALAIVDDIGAVLVIAFFYTAGVSWTALLAAAAFLAAMVAANRLGVRTPLVYLLLGIGLWAAFLASGIHATVAGVLSAMAIPARNRIDTAEFLDRGRHLMEEFDAAGVEGADVLTNHGQQTVIQAIESTCEAAQSPLQRIEHDLQPWVAFIIIPLFALANAGVHLSGNVAEAFAHPVTLGVILGLVVGKPIGITLFSWAAVRAGLATRPEGITWRALHGVSWLGGIGFTMSLFIATLAFPTGAMVDEAKMGILAASLVAGIVGWLLLRPVQAPAAEPEPAPAAGLT